MLMQFKISTFVVAVTFVSTAAFAQSTATAPAPTAKASVTSFLHLTSQDIIQRLGTPGPSGTASSFIDTHEYYSSLLVTRNADGSAETHAHFHDFMSILSGEVMLTYGGTQTGNVKSNNGNSLGGDIVGGTTITLRAGDYIQIPAGMPHLMTKPKNGLRYLVVKVRD
jgi:mannose-6-phosphate isomerase-like protein (cupin superfamily)